MKRSATEQSSDSGTQIVLNFAVTPRCYLPLRCKAYFIYIDIPLQNQQ